MLEQLLMPAREQLEKVLNSQPIPRERNLTEMARVIAESIMQALSYQISTGKMTGLVELLSGRETPATSPEIQALLPHVMGNLAQRLGVPKSNARSIALFSIPVVLNMLNTKINRARQNGLSSEDLLCNLKGVAHHAQRNGQSDLIDKFIDNLLKQ